MSNDTPIAFPTIVEGSIGGALVPTVNARDLHAALGVGKILAAWINDRISGFGFSEHADFDVFSEIGNNLSGGRPINIGGCVVVRRADLQVLVDGGPPSSRPKDAR